MFKKKTKTKEVILIKTLCQQMLRKCYELKFIFLCHFLGLIMDQSQVCTQILHMLVFHKPILSKTIYKHVVDLLIILMSQMMSQSIMNQQRKRPAQKM